MLNIQVLSFLLKSFPLAPFIFSISNNTFTHNGSGQHCHAPTYIKCITDTKIQCNLGICFMCLTDKFRKSQKVSADNFDPKWTIITDETVVWNLYTLLKYSFHVSVDKNINHTELFIYNL